MLIFPYFHVHSELPSVLVGCCTGAVQTMANTSLALPLYLIRNNSSFLRDIKLPSIHHIEFLMTRLSSGLHSLRLCTCLSAVSPAAAAGQVSRRRRRQTACFIKGCSAELFFLHVRPWSHFIWNHFWTKLMVVIIHTTKWLNKGQLDFIFTQASLNRQIFKIPQPKAFLLNFDIYSLLV